MYDHSSVPPTINNVLVPTYGTHSTQRGLGGLETMSCAAVSPDTVHTVAERASF